MASSVKYGTFYRIRMFVWFQLVMILETFANMFHFLHLYRRRRARMPDSLEGKTVLITGANAGIGKETAKVCVKLGAKVIMACRDQEKAKLTIQDICAEMEKDKKDNLYLVELDLSSLQSVRNCAEKVRAQFPVIDCLINNAGMMMSPEWRTVDGYEMQFATNHLGHFLLTNLLIEQIKASPKARIVNLSSVAHIPGIINFENINLLGEYTPLKAYAQSKLANVLFTRELAKRLASTNITVYAAHPGLVNTDLKRHLNKVQQFFLDIFNRMILIEPIMGAQTSLYCAFDSEVQNQSGFYYANCSRITNLSAHVTDEQDAALLWDLSLKMCDIENNNMI